MRASCTAPEARSELFAELTGPESILDAYRELCSAPATPAVSRSSAEPPLVSIVIPYFELERHVAETVASAAAQTHPNTEILIVNDGSFRPEDEILFELESRYGLTVIAQPNSGLGAARNLGVELSRGAYVLPLDADNLLEAGFVARCVAAMEADPEIAYVTSWLRYIDERGRPWKGTEEVLRPIGNSSRAVEELNVAGDAVAVIRRSVFDAGLRYSTDVAGFEDWTLYREMRQRGLVGHVIPEPLIGYRLRDDSMMRALTGPREDWARQALDAHLAEARVSVDGAGSMTEPNRDQVEQLERENRALRRANAKLMRERLGSSNTGAAGAPGGLGPRRVAASQRRLAAAGAAAKPAPRDPPRAAARPALIGDPAQKSHHDR